MNDEPYEIVESVFIPNKFSIDHYVNVEYCKNIVYHKRNVTWNIAESKKSSPIYVR